MRKDKGSHSEASTLADQYDDEFFGAVHAFEWDALYVARHAGAGNKCDMAGGGFSPSANIWSVTVS
jgi:hypothetical protein